MWPFSACHGMTDVSPFGIITFRFLYSVGSAFRCFFLGLTRYMFIEVRFKGGVFHVGYLMVPLHFLLTACKRKRNPQIFSKINIWKCVIKLLDCILSSGEKFIPWSKPKPVILASLFRKWQSSLSIEMIGQWGLWNEPVSLVATCLKSEIRPLLLFWG